MKKWLIGILIALAFAVFLIYIIIPTHIKVSSKGSMKTTRATVYRLLVEKNEWRQWWPGDNPVNESSTRFFLFNGNRYHINITNYNSLGVNIVHDNDTIARTTLLFIEGSRGLTRLQWDGIISSSNNPVERIEAYRQSSKIKNDLDSLLAKMASFFIDKKKVYGIDISRQSVKDSTLISTYDTCQGYPSTEFVYSLINQLIDYSDAKAATITGYPMLNIYTRDSILYQVKVALPVNKKLPPKNRISYKWMLGGGNILVTEVKGGPTAAARAFEQLEYYVRDNNRVPPAIPFFSLITNRSVEKDTSRWVTKVYYPVIE